MSLPQGAGRIPQITENDRQMVRTAAIHGRNLVRKIMALMIHDKTGTQTDCEKPLSRKKLTAGAHPAS